MRRLDWVLGIHRVTRPFTTGPMTHWIDKQFRPRIHGRYCGCRAVAVTGGSN